MTYGHSGMQRLSSLQDGAGPDPPSGRQRGLGELQELSRPLPSPEVTLPMPFLTDVCLTCTYRWLLVKCPQFPQARYSRSSPTGRLESFFLRAMKFIKL